MNKNMCVDVGTEKYFYPGQHIISTEEVLCEELLTFGPVKPKGYKLINYKDVYDNNQLMRKYYWQNKETVLVQMYFDMSEQKCVFPFAGSVLEKKSLVKRFKNTKK